jgi:aspartate 1-decarboxylase
VNNGARFETYAMPGGAGEVCLNGAAARLVQPGDLVIIFTYGDFDEDELAGFTPRLVHVDEKNRLLEL